MFYKKYFKNNFSRSIIFFAVIIFPAFVAAMTSQNYKIESDSVNVGGGFGKIGEL